LIYTNDDDNSDIAKLMHDFRCSDADDMKLKLLADRTRYFKETKEGVSYMCKINEKMRNEAKQGKSVDIALNLLALGTLSNDDIANATGLTLEEVNELANHK